MNTLTCTMEVAGANIAEELSVSLGDLLPLRNVRHKHASAHDILQADAGLLQSAFYIS